ncbi:MAG: branched-chain amino acid ABC transporter permease [Chloroflexi bacterium]|nr:branched-chain amino acid ABC transporter permease [Chloroflexota bacterium]
MKSSSRTFISVLFVIALLAFVTAIPSLPVSKYWQTLGFITFLFAGMSVAWNILGGYGGQVSFGHGTFLGLGAFTTAVISIRTGIPAPLTIPIAGLVAMVYGVLWGYPTLRLRGPYFSIATIGIGEATRLLMINLDDLLRGAPFLNELVKDRPFTGGASGLNLKIPPDIISYQLNYYYFALAFLVITILIAWWIRRARFGLALFAINMDPDAAETLGVNTARYKVYALMVSAFLVGVAGSLYAQYFLFIDPREMFSFQNSIAMVLMPIIGGIGTVGGPVLGAFVFKVVEDRLATTRLEFGTLTINLVQFNLLLYGLLLVLIILFERGGVLGLLSRAAKKIQEPQRRQALAEKNSNSNL